MNTDQIIDLNELDEDNQSLDSDEVEYDMLLQECYELIEQSTVLRNQNEQQIQQINSNLEESNENETIRVQPFNIPNTKHQQKYQGELQFDNVDQVWEDLIKEKQMLEDQWTDNTLELRKKQRQLEDYHIELKDTKQKIDQVSITLKDKEDFVKSLKEQYDKLVK